jgi:hypothetical protein
VSVASTQELEGCSDASSMSNILPTRRKQASHPLKRFHAWRDATALDSEGDTGGVQTFICATGSEVARGRSRSDKGRAPLLFTVLGRGLAYVRFTAAHAASCTAAQGVDAVANPASLTIGS